MEIKPLIIVDRFPSEKDWTLSEFSINGVMRGRGVEDEHRDVKKYGETRIPNGLYEIDFQYSPAFSKSYFVDQQGFLSPFKDLRFNKEHLLLTVLNVTNFSRVLWHWGNTDLDTKGCYLVGKNFKPSAGRKGVDASRYTYTNIYPIIFQSFQQAKARGEKTYVLYRDKAA